MIWDLALLIPNALFFLFLVIKWRAFTARLKSTQSLIISAFYYLQWGICTFAVLRAALHMGLPDQSTLNSILWLVIRFLILMLEVSVVVFGLVFGHIVNSKLSIRLTLFLTLFISLTYTTTQGALEFTQEWETSTGQQHWDIYAHGGMIFLFSSSTFLAAVYLIIVLLPITPLRSRWPMPAKKSFYVYASFLCLVNMVQSIGSALVFYEHKEGFCMVDTSTLLYFTLFSPLVHYVFLKDFFSIKLPDTLFYNEAIIDDGNEYVPNMGFSGGYSSYATYGNYSSYRYESLPRDDGFSGVN